MPRTSGQTFGWKPACGVWTLLHLCRLQHQEGERFATPKERKGPIKANHANFSSRCETNERGPDDEIGVSREREVFLEQVYLEKGWSGNPFFHHFRTKNGDKGVENSRLWWIDCGQRVDNPLTALQRRVKREEENETFEHKKREPINGSLVLNRIK